MIAKLAGLVDQVGSDSAVIDVGGVGYLAFCSTRTIGNLPPAGAPVTLLIETHVREDHIHLYGFTDRAERDWFRRLTTVQGVGARLALAILSVISSEELGLAILAQDKVALTRADGVGPRLATRIVNELRDKLDSVAAAVPPTPLIAPTLIRRRYRDQVRLLTLPPFWQCVVALSRSRTVSNLYKRFIIAEGDIDQRTAQANFDNQLRVNTAAAREWLRDGIQNEGLRTLLARAKPTLVIVAEHDHMVDTARLHRLIGERPNIRLLVDRDQGHGWNREAVQRQLGVMQEFFGEGAAAA